MQILHQNVKYGFQRSCPRGFGGSSGGKGVYGGESFIVCFALTAKETRGV